MVVFGVAGLIAVAVLAVITRAGRTPHVCHYCGLERPRRELCTIELTDSVEARLRWLTGVCTIRKTRTNATFLTYRRKAENACVNGKTRTDAGFARLGSVTA